MTITTRHSRTRRAFAAAGALALGLIGVAGVAGSASADTVGDVGNIDVTQDGHGSLVITKYERSSSNGSTAGNGTPVTVSGDTINGVTFSIQEVVTSPGNASLDLTTNAGWTQAQAIKSAWSASAPTTLPSGYALTTAVTQTTAGAGVATFANLGFGLYLVRETTPLAEGIIDPALPFLVTIPFPTGTLAGNSAEWLYDVHVYPKNGVTELTKDVIGADVDDAFYTQAGHVSWTIASDVPLLPNTQNLTQFRLVDTIDTAELAFVATSATLPTDVSGYAVRAYAAGSTTPLAGLTTAMYTIDEAASATGTLELRFTNAGLTYLQDNAQGGHVEFDVPTTVVTPGTETLENDVTSYVNSSVLHADAEQPFGELLVFKYAETTGATPTETPLTGATFQLYADGNGNGYADTGELVTIGGQTSWTVTSVDGTLHIAGIKPGAYMLVESSAPAGYVTPTGSTLGSAENPHDVTVVAGAADAGTGVNYQDVENYQVDPWMLPFTGGNGVLTFSLTGAGLMALALGFAFVAFRRRKRAEQH
ncbi:SpaH/EbpB family LPXTG-anchored major pilin [Protaetiibacter intestinalis]|nr:SpaH/EbpB family LPXTG-anchored major pilin [Protaetiibacter intestinalis]